MQITINITNDHDTPSVVIDNMSITAPAEPEAEPIPRIVPAFPMRMDDGERAMLFAAYRNAFGSERDIDKDRMQRHAFTRATLGMTYNDDPSWSRNGTLTADQAFHMIRVLDIIADIL